MAARLLCVGDMHLGRRPTRLPADLLGLGVDAAALTPAAAWRASVDRALTEEVDAVLLAGDVVDRHDDRFEAYGWLRNGVERLVEAGIAVIGVAGNHDVEALPRLAEQIDAFRLLGAGGRWERLRLEGSGGPPVAFVGWSFPEARVSESPLDGLAAVLSESRPDEVVVGLLHCDLDRASSAYAPVERAALLASQADAWLLGHIHRPDDLAGRARPVGYLGSLCALDPGDVGARGPWLVEVEGKGRVRARPLPLSPVRYERVELDVADFDARDPDHLEDALFDALREALGSLEERLARAGEVEGDGLRLVLLRVLLIGRGRHHALLERIVSAGLVWPSEVRRGVAYAIECVVPGGAPALDLERLAAGDDPPALLARRLLILEAGGDACQALLARAAAALAADFEAPRWRRVDPLPADEALRAILLRAGRRQLDALLAQRSGGPAGAMPGRWGASA